MRSTPLSEHIFKRAQGAWLGQLAGDSLGSLVEFQTAATIANAYPQGIRELVDGGTWNTLAGQPTDDSEMALALVNSLLEESNYAAAGAMTHYQRWYQSQPFDIGFTTVRALTGDPNHDSQANGALMRASPLGIVAVGTPLTQRCAWAAADAALTHPHANCVAINQLYVAAIATAIESGSTGADLYEQITRWARQWDLPAEVTEVTEKAARIPVQDYQSHMGWVMIAWHNALWQLLSAPSLEEGIIDTVMQGGDTDTNAAICGALLGAVYGLEAVPTRNAAQYGRNYPLD
ncbi:ADP-ribosylglycohydrolase family protein [Ectothiorhodospiraceae bacterium BW-2]|nr:ADP-ribosylglycohydrolase family protein [Ectothiorhodospiraceae bacterium BW-2]